jgi:hypothetical protein
LTIKQFDRRKYCFIPATGKLYANDYFLLLEEGFQVKISKRDFNPGNKKLAHRAPDKNIPCYD